MTMGKPRRRYPQIEVPQRRDTLYIKPLEEAIRRLHVVNPQTVRELGYNEAIDQVLLLLVAHGAGLPQTK